MVSESLKVYVNSQNKAAYRNLALHSKLLLEIYTCHRQVMTSALLAQVCI